jgi:hypothetical protein
VQEIYYEVVSSKFGKISGQRPTLQHITYYDIDGFKDKEFSYYKFKDGIRYSEATKYTYLSKNRDSVKYEVYENQDLSRPEYFGPKLLRVGFEYFDSFRNLIRAEKYNDKGALIWREITLYDENSNELRRETYSPVAEGSNIMKLHGIVEFKYLEKMNVKTVEWVSKYYDPKLDDSIKIVQTKQDDGRVVEERLDRKTNLIKKTCYRYDEFENPIEMISNCGERTQFSTNWERTYDRNGNELTSTRFVDGVPNSYYETKFQFYEE